MDLPIEMDLGRRDFTVNAMAYNLRTKALIDPHSGRRDLDAKLLRAVGNPEERLREDLTRMLRAIRFSCSLALHIEEQTWAAIQDLASHINDQRSDEWVVARDMIGREFLKSFFHDPACTLVKYQNAGLFPMLFPGFDGKAALELTSDAAGLSPRLLVALLLTTADPVEGRHLAEAYRFYQFPKASRFHIDLEEIMWLIRSSQALSIVEDPGAMPGSLFERLFLGEKSEDLLSLMQLSHAAPEQKITAVRERIAEIRARLGEDIPDLVGGEDLIKAGLQPGPTFRAMMTKIRDAQIAGEISSKTEALDYLKTLL